MALGLLLPAGAQAPPDEPPPPRFRESVNVSRVLIDLRVVDSHGQAVTGLRPEHFRLEVDGAEVPVESVHWVDETPGAAAPAAHAPAAAPDPLVEHVADDVVVYADEAQAPADQSPSGRLVVLLFQKDLSEPSRVPGLIKMRKRAAEMTRRLGPGDRVAVLSFDSQLRFWLDFSADRKRLERTLERSILFETPVPIDPGDPPSLAEHFDRQAARRAAHIDTGLLVLARALEPLPGHKSVVLFGWGMGVLSGGMVHMEYDYGDAVAALARARATVFALDITEADYHTLEAGLMSVAEDTGGFYAKTYNFPGVAMDLLERALVGHYELAFPAPEAGGWHSLKVRLKGHDGTVLAPTSFES